MESFKSIRLHRHALLVLFLIGSLCIPEADGGPGSCATCAAAAYAQCGSSTTGGFCAAVYWFPPLFLACLIKAGGSCALTAGACLAICISPSP